MDNQTGLGLLLSAVAVGAALVVPSKTLRYARQQDELLRLWDQQVARNAERRQISPSPPDFYGLRRRSDKVSEVLGDVQLADQPGQAQRSLPGLVGSQRVRTATAK